MGNGYNDVSFAHCSQRSVRDSMSLFMTLLHDKPLCYSPSVSVKCLLLRRFCILNIFHGYCRLSNDIQIRKHTRIQSELASF